MEENITRKNSLIETYGFNNDDFKQIESLGISWDTIANQLSYFQKGIPKINLESAATLQNGIWKLSENEFKEKVDFFDQEKVNLKLEKFVPASGAASRMFEFLNEFLTKFDIETDTINSYINKNKATSLTIFLAGIEKFPFFDLINQKLKENYPDFSIWNRDQKIFHFIRFLIGYENFDFANKPKGILPFHKYKNHIATPIEEHLNESAYYTSSNNISNLHFTISKIHQEQFEEILTNVKSKIESENSTKINISFSCQNPKTDTLAVDLNNKPFRDANDKLIFRPGGHGALIENLNNIDTDIIFIKNIDNVIHNHIKTIAFFKKALAGILIDIQNQTFGYIKHIESKMFSDIEEIIEFSKNKLNINFPKEFEDYSLQGKGDFIKKTLNKPIRVCGMVKNENEPGGGPFWIRKEDTISLQIVESSQVDLLDTNQVEIFNTSTHFNPVDIVCGVKDYQGNKFDLTKYIDHNSGFIVKKNKEGKVIKAYELPGLWNGAMANWLTIFVEVPLITFNPVKTANDLLKPAHQPQ